MDSLDSRITYKYMDPQTRMEEYLGEVGMPTTHEDFELIEHRIYHDYIASVDFDMDDHNHRRGSHKKNYTPYEHDLSQYPEVFQKYQENYAKYDEVKERFATENPLEE